MRVISDKFEGISIENLVERCNLSGDGVDSSLCSGIFAASEDLFRTATNLDCPFSLSSFLNKQMCFRRIWTLIFCSIQYFTCVSLLSFQQRQCFLQNKISFCLFNAMTNLQYCKIKVLEGKYHRKELTGRWVIFDAYVASRELPLPEI